MSGYKKEQHYVPELLLRPWLVKNDKAQDVLLAYYWNEHDNSVWSKDRLGTNGYCYQPDLMTVDEHPEGRDVLEAKFFEEIDNNGGQALLRILREGLSNLTEEQKRDFAFLLLSLEARRPEILEKLRSEGASFLREKLDSDITIRKVCEQEGIEISPSEYFEKHVAKLADRALLAALPYLTRSPIGLPALQNCYWLVREMASDALKLVISDRPLIRVEAATHPDRIWCLPLSPNVLFLASPNKILIQGFLKKSDNHLVRSANVESVRQRDRYVFSVDKNTPKWLVKQLRH